MATISDLYRVDGKAELIGDRIMHYPAQGCAPSHATMEIAVALRRYEDETGRGVARARSIGFVLPKPLRSGRQSFSPDVVYHLGPLPENRMHFIEGAPTFAIEVRIEGDYTTAGEQARAAKRADYFEAGTQVVWDVDPIARTIASYRASAPMEPTVFKAGDTADAEPAVPGWTVAVDDIFVASA